MDVHHRAARERKAKDKKDFNWFRYSFKRASGDLVNAHLIAAAVVQPDNS
jgi:hypothetical protein